MASTGNCKDSAKNVKEEGAEDFVALSEPEQDQEWWQVLS